MPSGLKVVDAHARYGRAVALSGARLEVTPGRVTALVGPNGAGKSTLLKLASGVVRGKVQAETLDGQSIAGLNTLQRARAGLVLVPQGRQLFPRLTVLENLQVVRDSLGLPADALDSALDRFPILRERVAALAGVLSGGEQQMLAIARGLMPAPSILLLDEPTLGLSPSMVTDVMTTVGKLAREGVGVLIAEPSVQSFTVDVSGGYVLVRGRTVAQATTAGLLAESYRQQMGVGPPSPAS